MHAMLKDSIAPHLRAPQSVPEDSAWNLEQIRPFLVSPLPEFIPAAVLVGLIERKGVDWVILTRRNEALRQHAGQISFPGGRIEEDDADPVAAALREAREEIGLLSDQAEVLGYLDPFLTISAFHVYPVVARIAPSFETVPDEREVAEVFEVPLAYFLDPENVVQAERSWMGHTRLMPEFHWGEHRIWGATAMMLINLRERLAGSHPAP